MQSTTQFENVRKQTAKTLMEINLQIKKNQETIEQVVQAKEQMID